MKSKATHNFHLPLPRETYRRLRELSKRRSMPATKMARDAINQWLEQQEKEERDRQIETYAQAVAGTDADIDETLEAASIEHLMETEIE